LAGTKEADQVSGPKWYLNTSGTAHRSTYAMEAQQLLLIVAIGLGLGKIK